MPPKKKESKVTEIYDSYIASLNDAKSKRYDGKESWFHSSSAGACARKHYFSSVMKVQGTPRDAETLRLFRLGDVIHQDIQDAVRWYADSNGARILIEKELYIEDWNVRGFIDLAMVDDGVLYDIKSCNDWKWRSMFGRKFFDEKSIENYMLQTATYGYWYQENVGQLDGMALLFYNKNNSMMREVEIPMEVMEHAESYWESMVELADLGEAPPIFLGIAPAQEWECNEKYCSYFDVCGGGLKGNG